MNARTEDFELEPPSEDLQAAEYVLGVLDADGRRRAQARIEAEPGFAGLVAQWERRFAALIAEIAPMAVPAHVWLRIRTQLGWSAVDGARPKLLQRVSFWRGATAAALATAAVLAVVAIMRPLPTPEPVSAPTPIVVAPPAPPPVPTPAPLPTPAPITTLAADDGSPAFLASLDLQNNTVRVMSLPAAPDGEGRVPELWLIPEGEAPRSLGVIDTSRTYDVAVPDDLRYALTPGSLLAVTLEPVGGAPDGAPTGPITAKAAIERI